MARVVKHQDKDVWMFKCPGCDKYHEIKTSWTESEKKDYEAWCRRNQWTMQYPTYTFNGDVNLPTFSPAIAVDPHRPVSTCHAYIQDGRIKFLPNSWHHLRGQTVMLSDIK